MRENIFQGKRQGLLNETSVNKVLEGEKQTKNPPFLRTLRFRTDWAGGVPGKVSPN